MGETLFPLYPTDNGWREKAAKQLSPNDQKEDEEIKEDENRVMQTSNFANLRRIVNPVAICRGKPAWYHGRQYERLAPTWQMLKKPIDPRVFDRDYKKMLSRLDPEKVFLELGRGSVLLCWEPFNQWCHRRIVAEWLERSLGIEIPEVGHERSESLPCDTMMSRYVG